jgi:hypothetical protein
VYLPGQPGFFGRRRCVLGKLERSQQTHPDFGTEKDIQTSSGRDRPERLTNGGLLLSEKITLDYKNMNVYEPPYGHWFPSMPLFPPEDASGHHIHENDDPENAATPGHLADGESGLPERKSRPGRARTGA